MLSVIEGCREQRLAWELGCSEKKSQSMSSKSKSIGIIGAPFSKGQVSKKPGFE